MSNHSRNKKPVVQMNLEGETLATYESLTAAAAVTGANPSNILKVINGDFNQTKGFKWKAAEPDNDATLPVNELVELYDDIKTAIEKYCILKEGYSDILTCWVMGTYFISKINKFPLLAITAPDHGCGKSQVLQTVCTLAKCGTTVAQPSPAVLYRSDKSVEPTWGVDEVDQWLRTEAALNDVTPLLNSAFARGEDIPRVDGLDSKVKFYPMYMAIALSGIQIEYVLRKPTLSRCILIPVNKEKGAPSITKPELEVEFAELRLNAKHTINIAKSNYVKTNVPGNLASRIVDVWIPIFSIAAMISNTVVKAITKIFNAEYAVDEEETENTKLLRIAYQYIDHSSVLTHQPNNKPDAFIFAKSLYEQVIQDAEYLEQDITLTATMFTQKLKGLGVTADRVSFAPNIKGVTGLNKKSFLQICRKSGVTK